MVDSPNVWYKLKTTANINENRMENPLSTLVDQKTEESSKIYIIFKKEHNLLFKMFNCNNYFFEKAKTIDVSELGSSRVDFALQKIVYVSDRLVLIKQTYRCDQKAMIMYEIKLNKAFPIKTKLIEDLLNNSIEAKQDGLVFFGGHNQQLQPHSRVFFYSFLVLRFEEVEPKTGPSPEPRFLAFSKVIKNQLVITGGYNSYPNFYKEEAFKDIWALDFKTNNWSQIIQPNLFPSSVTLCADKGEDILFLCDNKRTSLNIYNHTKKEFTSIKTSASIEIEKGVILLDEHPL